MLVLKVLQSPDDSGAPVGTLFRVPEGGRRILGRSKKSHIRVQAKNISRGHAEFIPVDDWWYVKDLGSKNGTIVNQKKINKPVLLRTGDTVVLADHTFQAEMTSAPLTNEDGSLGRAVVMVTPEGFEAVLPIPGDPGTDPQVQEARKPIEKVDPNQGLQLEDSAVIEEELEVVENIELPPADSNPVSTLESFKLSEELDMPLDLPEAEINEPKPVAAAPQQTAPNEDDQKNLLLESLELSGLDDLDQPISQTSQTSQMSQLNQAEQAPKPPSLESMEFDLPEELSDPDELEEIVPEPVDPEPVQAQQPEPLSATQPAPQNEAAEEDTLSSLSGSFEILDLDDLENVEELDELDVAEISDIPVAAPASVDLTTENGKSPSHDQDPGEETDIEELEPLTVGPANPEKPEELNKAITSEDPFDDDETLPGILRDQKAASTDELDKWIKDGFPKKMKEPQEGSSSQQNYAANFSEPQPSYPASDTDEMSLPNKPGEDTEKLGPIMSDMTHSNHASEQDPFGGMDSLDYKGQASFDDDDNEETMVWEDTLELEELESETSTQTASEAAPVLLEAPPKDFVDPAFDHIDQADSSLGTTAIEFADWQVRIPESIKDWHAPTPQPKAIRLRRVIAGRPPMAYAALASPIAKPLAAKLTPSPINPVALVTIEPDQKFVSPIREKARVYPSIVVQEIITAPDQPAIRPSIKEQEALDVVDAGSTQLPVAIPPLPTENRRVRIRLKARAKPKVAHQEQVEKPQLVRDQPELLQAQVLLDTRSPIRESAQTEKAISLRINEDTTSMPAFEYTLTSIPHTAILDTIASSIVAPKRVRIRIREVTRKRQPVPFELAYVKPASAHDNHPKVDHQLVKALIRSAPAQTVSHTEADVKHSTIVNNISFAPKPSLKLTDSVAAHKPVAEKKTKQVRQLAKHKIENEKPSKLAIKLKGPKHIAARQIIDDDEELLPAIIHGIAAPRHKRLRDENWRELLSSHLESDHLITDEEAQGGNLDDSLAELSGFLDDEPVIENPIDEVDEELQVDELITKEAQVQDNELHLVDSSSLENLESSATESTLLLDLVKTPAVTPHWIEEANRKRRNNPWLISGIIISCISLIVTIIYLISINL